MDQNYNSCKSTCKIYHVLFSFRVEKLNFMKDWKSIKGGMKIVLEGILAPIRENLEAKGVQ